MGSGPARALSLKPKKVFAQIEYKDTANVAILVLETSQKPEEEVIAYLAKECNVEPQSLYIILTPTSSMTGTTQISGRVVESGLHKLMELGFDLQKIIAGYGYAPIAPIHPKFTIAMGRTNDMILYGGVVWFTLSWDDDTSLREILQQVPSSTSKDYGKPFSEIFKAAKYDFYNIDPALFAPAVIMVNNITTGSFLKAGSVNADVLKQSIMV
jgi:methenyltetrahydromethanopterin cyclohydrolase